MQRDLPRQRGAAPGFTFDAPLENEGEIVDGLLAALVRNQLPPEAWSSLHLAAVRDDRLAELAEAYAAVGVGKRLKAAPPAVAAEFFFRAGLFSADAANDAPRALDFWRRAIAANPMHPSAFGRIESLLIDSGDKRGQAELYIGEARHRSRSEQADLLRRATTLLEGEPDTEEILLEQYQEILRLEPRDEETREKLEARYLEANRPKDVARLLEQALSGDPPPDDFAAKETRARLVRLYAGPLGELERALPHVEALLAEDPEHEDARAAAQRLLEVKALAARAAAALAQATEATGTPADVAKMLAIELEHTRGPKRRDVLRRLGILRQDGVGDEAGAYEAFEQSLALDPSDPEVLRRYADLAVALHKELDAGRSLARFGAAARDPQVRARLSAEVGQLFLAGGDPKRARASFVAVLTMPEVPPDVALGVSRSLAGIYATERDYRSLADALERVALLEPDDALRQTANEELAELAQSTLRDAARAITAWRRLVETGARGRALAALEPLYEATGNAVDLAFVVEERSLDEADPEAARALAFRAASILTSKPTERAKASEAWARFSQRFGADRGALAAWLPILEAEEDWVRLSMALEAEASLAPDDERAALFVKLGQVRLQRTNDEPGAIDAFAEALLVDPAEPTGRASLERLAANGTARLAAARVLEPHYRAEQHVEGILRVLDLKARFLESADERLLAIEEALRISEELDVARAADWIARGLGESVAARSDVGTWILRLDDALAATDPARLSTILKETLGEQTVDSPELLLLARRAAEAHVALGNVAVGLALYRRALAHEPSSSELLASVDALLRAQGTPEDRIALYRAALAHAPDRARRRELLSTIGSIERRDLRDPERAIATYELAAQEDAEDRVANTALDELYTETARWDALLALLERARPRATAVEARALRARMAEVATKQSDFAAATSHANALLADPALEEAELVVLERVAGSVEDTTMLRAVLERRATLAEDPARRVEWLDRLGALELACAEPELAIATWKRAAALAETIADEAVARRLYERVREVSPHDGEAAYRLADLLERAEDWAPLPDLYAVMLEHSELPSVRIGVLMRHARLLAEHLDDPGSALISAAQAFELAASSSSAGTSAEYREVLSTFTMLALRGKATHIFAQAMDDAIDKNAGAEPERALRRAELRMSKARVLAANREGRDAAVAAYRAILEDPGTAEPQVKGALHALESLLSSEASDARRSDRRWLFAWRAEREEGPEKAAALETWAVAEEVVFGEPDRALELYRRVLAVDPENVRVLAAVARLALGSGDASAAVLALTAQRDRSEGAARRAVDLEIAGILLHRLSRAEEAQVVVARVLAEAPDEALALALATELMGVPSVRAAMMTVLESAQVESRDSGVRARILGSLLDAAGDGAGSAEVRGRWFDSLFELQRAEGHAELALKTALAAAHEQPKVSAFWDRADDLARELQRPDEVASAYRRALEEPLPVELATELGQRGVAFQEEWFENPEGVVQILERVLAIDPHADWAFDRLKMLFDAGERWPELFALYDKAISTADEARQASLYEDAAQIAKDFANDSDRAIGYLEKLLALRPSDAHLVASLERLYERKGAYRELVALLTRQIAGQKGADAQRTRERISTLWLDELSDASRALDVAIEILEQTTPTVSASGGDVDAFALIERVMESAPRAASDTVLEPKPVRYRAAALLSEHYERIGRDVDLTRVLEVLLEIARGPAELAKGHRRIATFRAKLGDDETALEHIAALVLLEPATGAYRVELFDLASRVGRFDRLADVLAQAAERADGEALRAELSVAAGDVWVTKLGDEGRATTAYLGVLSAKNAPTEFVLAAARKVEPLLERASRAWDLLEVLERLAALEDSTEARSRAWTLAARLAQSLGDPSRAIAAWEARLREGADAEGLDALIDLLEREARWRDLIAALRSRSEGERSLEGKQADRSRIAQIFEVRVGDLQAAVDEWTVIEANFGASDASTDALCTLLERVERWAPLEEKLEAAAARATTTERRAELSARLGDVARLHRADPSRARASYHAALASSPRDARARAGLLALARADEQRAEALQDLLAAFAETDDWSETLELVELRLAAAAEDSVRVRVLVETAKLAENRGDDPKRAFEFVARAFVLAPADAELTAEFTRLAATTASWRDYANAHELVLGRDEPAASLGDPIARAAFRHRLGRVFEDHLGDATTALRLFEEAAREAPADLTIALDAVRAAARLSRWDAVSQAIVGVSRGRGATSEEAVRAAAEQAEAGHGWDALTTALAAAVASAAALPEGIARDLEANLGAWHRDRRGDPDAAEAAYARALAHDASNTELLTSLAQIQRRAKGRPLVDSLLRLSEATGGDLELLREAAEVAVSTLADRGLAKSILGSLLALAEARWLGANQDVAGAHDDPDAAPVSVGATHSPEPVVRWAIGELSRIHDDDGHPERRVELLAGAARLPWERGEARQLLHQAARIARETVHDDARAIELYEGLFASNSHDEEATAALIALYEGHAKHAELLALYGRLVALADEPATRVRVRLAAARLEEVQGQPDAALALLRANLTDSARDGATLAAIVAVLEAHGRFGELTDAYVNQAELAEAAVENAVAATFWLRAAGVAEQRLSDADRAIRYYRRTLPLDEQGESLDALARLLSARGEHAAAAEMLGRLLATTAEGARTALTLRWVEALVLAGSGARAREELEAAAGAAPDDEALRLRLVAMYEAEGAWQALALLHRATAARATDTPTRLTHLRAAADLFIRRCRTPDAAIPLLEEAAQLDPDDRASKLSLADALVHGARYDEARALLRSVIDGFGARRPKERGAAHYHLALLEVATGNRAQGLVELDAATKIDPGNPRVLRALAELARDDGQIDRAERSYRALLVALRRPEDATEDAPMVRSEVLLELSSIASGQGQENRARELVESALESASKSLVEGRRLEQALREKKDFPTLVRALEARLERASTDGERALALTETARVLDVELGHLARAFTARQRVLALTPNAAEAHEASLALARRVDGVARYLEDLEALALAEERHGRRDAASALYFRLGQTLEAEAFDDARTLAAYERSLAVATAESGDAATGPFSVNAPPSRQPSLSKHALTIIRALEPVYARLGNVEARARLLTQRVEVESVEDDPKAAADARYRLAEYVFGTREGALDGVLLVSQALDLDHDVDRAEGVVRGAVALHGKDEGLIDLFERLGRIEGHDAALLEALELRSELPGASADVVREAAALATTSGQEERALALLQRFVERAGDEDVAWAFEQLAALREAAGDAAAAIGWKKRAADVAIPEDARRLRFEMARLTAEALHDLAGAAVLYEVLFEEDPTDRSAWEPLLAAYRTLNDTANLVLLLPRVADQAGGEEERSRLRFERVRLLVDSLGQSLDAIAPLSDLVAEDPKYPGAAPLLADLLEQSGRTDDLAELLGRLIDAARDAQDAKEVEALSLRRARLVLESDPDEARATLYSALDWTPDSRPVLELLVQLLNAEDRLAERLDLKERLLALAAPADVEKAALELAALRTTEGNHEAAERALEIGFKVNPGSQALRERLETAYREANASSKLADLYAVEARSLADPDARVARLREVAALYNEVPDAKRAAGVLAEAFVLEKRDPRLATELAAAYVAARDIPAAVAVLSEMLEDTREEGAARAALLLERANLRVELGDDEAAATDLIAVARLGVINVSPSLDLELERVRARAEARGDAPVERTMRLELATVRAEGGDLDAARPLVTELLRREPKDREALRLLARIEERAERWDAATVAYRRLIPLEEGDLAVDTALRLADACERAGRLADARGALERTRTAAPHDEALRLRLERLYESIGAYRELAEMSFDDARSATDDAARCGHLKRAGSLLLQDGSDTDAAVDALVEAHALSSGDMKCTLLLVDAYTIAGKTTEAEDMIAAEIAARGGRRSPELASLYHRLARVAHVQDNRPGELSALLSALEADAQNGFVAAELASLALEIGDIEVATRALRSITLLKDVSTSHIPKALAYQYLGEIARQQGDPKRAMLLLKRAIEDDPTLETARALIEELRSEGA